MLPYATNPPWVNRLLRDNWAAIEKRVDPSWLPMMTEGSDKRRPVFEEFGCGHYGCVLPASSAPSMVLKITTDPLEAHFVASALKIGRFPDGIVRYYSIYQLEGGYRKRPAYAIWREEAFDVGSVGHVWYGGSEGPPWYKDLDEYDKRSVLQFIRALTRFQRWAGEFKVLFDRSKDKSSVWDQLAKYEDWAFQTVELERVESDERPATHLTGVRRMAYLLRGCEVMAELMENERGGYLVGGALGFYLEHGLLLADVHLGNIGRVRREDYSSMELAITDPGHAVATKASSDTVTVEHV